MKEQLGTTAYLNLCKNTKHICFREPKKATIDDFKNVAKKALTIADEFYGVSNVRNIAASINLFTNAVFANIAFACELYMKALIFYRGNSIEKEHSISELFNKLQDNEKI